MNERLAEAIGILVAATPNPSEGLPEDIFYFASRITPLVNVDLLIKDELGRCLLAWRDDPFSGSGWHIPGGIIRLKETFSERIRQVALKEIGVTVEFDPEPIAINEMINPGQELRGHFISLLFRCRLPSSFVPDNGCLLPNDPGYLQWHEGCPQVLVPYHERYYRTYI